MKGKKKILFVLVLLLLVGLTSGYVASTYAKYASKLNDKQGSVQVAKWAFEDKNQATELKINLDGTYNADTLTADRIAPGTEGSFEVKLVNTETETGVIFTATLSDLSNVPTNLKFYTDDSRTTPFELSTGATITGQLAALDSDGVSIPIYWKWDFGTSPDPSDTINFNDTRDGKAAKDLSVTLSITGVQMEPNTSTSETEFKSKVNSWTN